MTKNDPNMTEALDRALKRLGPFQQREFLRQAHNRYRRLYVQPPETKREWKRRYYQQPDIKEQRKAYYYDVVRPRRIKAAIEKYKRERMENDDTRGPR